MTNIRAVMAGAVILGGLAGCNAATEAPTSLRISRTESGKTLTPASQGTPVQVLADYLGRTTAGLKVEQSAAGADGITHVRVNQELGGVRVVGAYARAAVLPSGALVHVIDALVPEQPVPAAKLTASQALHVALAHHGFTSATLALRGTSGTVTTFEPNDEFYQAPFAERVAYTDALGKLQSGFLVETWSGAKNVLNHTLIDDAGQVVSVELRTNNDRYNVFIEDPSKGAQTLVNGPGAGNVESPAGWLSGAQLSINVQGNNANAYLDVDKNNRPDRGGVSITNGDFLTVVDLTQAPGTTDNRAVAVQNLFYLNNVVHDVLYRHGFNEVAGNFQVDNFGKGGAGNDPVQAEAQDGSGTDNANFSTPTDGSKPRMQMYLWSGYGATHEVQVGANLYQAMGAGFGAALTTTGLTGALAVYNDGTGVSTDACEASTGSLSGKIAIVTRGTCAFTVKVLNAQTAGAVAVIVANNDASAAFTMGGTDRKVKIPSVMVTQADGNVLLLQAGAAATARKKAVQPLMLDGDLDSDIVFHEYGHGLTWRMIGSMSGKLAGAIGEGASDTVAFLINNDDLIGEYAYQGGIRSQPYGAFTRTYKDAIDNEVHADGEIYAAAMWRLKVLMGDDQALLSLFVDGMNYTPATPKFEDMRDGMLASDAAHSGANYCNIWRSFAKFGIGVGASGNPNTTPATIVESFVVPSPCPAP